MENMLCKCELCLKTYISDLHKKINELQRENILLKKKILQNESIVSSENTSLRIDIIEKNTTDN